MIFSSTSKQRSRSGFQPRCRYAAITLAASMSAAFAGPAIGGSESEVFSLHAKAADNNQITVEPSAAKGMGYATGYAIVDGHAVFEGDMVLARGLCVTGCVVWAYQARLHAGQTALFRINSAQL